MWRYWWFCGMWLWNKYAAVVKAVWTALITTPQERGPSLRQCSSQVSRKINKYIFIKIHSLNRSAWIPKDTARHRMTPQNYRRTPQDTTGLLQDTAGHHRTTAGLPQDTRTHRIHTWHTAGHRRTTAGQQDVPNTYMTYRRTPQDYRRTPQDTAG